MLVTVKLSVYISVCVHVCVCAGVCVIDTPLCIVKAWVHLNRSDGHIWSHRGYMEQAMNFTLEYALTFGQLQAYEIQDCGQFWANQIFIAL